MDGSQIEIQAIGDINAISPEEWDACAAYSDGKALDPFTTHRFLKALEDSQSVGSGTGWTPHHLIVRQDGKIIAVAPMYAKTNSQGEYIFDHGWADAYERAGGNYYPKLQIAVPFTPATGARFLTHRGYEDVGQSALLQGAIQLAVNNNLSSLHTTFCTEAEAIAGKELGLLHRTTQQYHWHNNGYATFDTFLDALSARKRKAIRKERRIAQAFGGTIHTLTGDQIRPENWDAFWGFYTDTGARKWGRPYLTRAFFECIQTTMRDDTLLVLAERDGVFVAGAMNMIGARSLYGRYWGCVEDHPCLHFELCYYQAIDYAIAHGLSTVEAGAQGDHKLARGYLPVETHSLHWIQDAGFREAVERFLVEEGRAVGREIEVLTSYGPFKSKSEKDIE
ncbi:GNAT family N-acetyltransferase [Cochlodiniinecator piscidefendens]|uniref:GNAT family N-acetyltransferase n=1 Tax=Cochlodiniinecator piscidefendens TaxID=2715756 RepID=UPI00140AD396|nr:GNAT family N-acetyltransferase [Cochlodiniinecator piscidefendens]